jgi:hypothetical protein
MSRRFRLTIRLLLYLLFVGFAWQAGGQTAPRSMVAQSQSQPKAQQLWEQAIAAKGGRTRLHSIRNLVISSTAEYVTHKGTKNTVRTEELFVFPNKIWTWEDMRPDVFGLRVDMSNYEAHIRYILTDEISTEKLRHLSDAYTWEDFGLLDTQAWYFMETNWVQPNPLACWTEAFNGQQVDVIKTEVKGRRIDFALHQTTHLPVRVIFYNYPDNPDKIRHSNELAMYSSVNGIQLPHRVTPQSGPAYTQQYQVNVEYNEAIFYQLTDIKDGPTGWKPKPATLNKINN